MRTLLAIATGLCVGIATASAQQGGIVDLKTVTPDRLVEAVGYCNGRYEVKLKDGSVR